MKSIHQIRKEVIDIGRRMYDRGYVAANDGNISVRIDESRLLITPTGVSKGFMVPEELVLCTMDGEPVSSGPRPSSEIRMHINVYGQRPEIRSVVHAHPPFTTAFGITGIPLTQAILPEVVLTLGGIPLVEYGTPGTDKLSEPLMPLLPFHDAFILQNHGALTIGTDIMNAYYRMETLEHFAYIAFISHLLGKIHTLPGPEVSKLLDQRSKMGFKGAFSPAACQGESNAACSILEPGETCVTVPGATPIPSDNPKTTISEETVRKTVMAIIEQFLA